MWLERAVLAAIGAFSMVSMVWVATQVWLFVAACQTGALLVELVALAACAVAAFYSWRDLKATFAR